MSPNVLYVGDNLEMLEEHVPQESVDLVYLDPPFNSRAAYHTTLHGAAGRALATPSPAFRDVWTWDERSAAAYAQLVRQGGRVAEALRAFRMLLDAGGMLTYLTMMAPRLRELHRVLKPTGSLYLHCDPSASHYLRVLLDAIFDRASFAMKLFGGERELMALRRRFGPIHDTLLFYTKSDGYFFRVVKRPYMCGHVARRYRKEVNGRFKFVSGGNVLTGANATEGESGQCWKGFDPAAKNRHWAIPGFLAQQMPDGFDELGVLAKLDALYDAGFIEIAAGAAWPVPVRYLKAGDGQPLQDIWAHQPYTAGSVHNTAEAIDADVAWLGPTDPERLGYPTQKPVGLLERIIRSSCPEGGVVLDPFCGCGTTLVAAQKLRRSWIGIDISRLAIDLTRKRFRHVFGIGLQVQKITGP